MLVEELLGELALPFPILCLRLFGAAVLCGLIGYEREAADHSAGLRTNMLVGLAAAVFALITVQMLAMFEHRAEVIRLDPIRLIEATTAGVAFLAAGMIFTTRGRVKNLTTGAVMWLSGGVGLAAGLGIWPVAGLAAGLGLLIGLLGRVTHRPPEEPG